MAEEKHQDNDPTFVAKKRNPIIFARTETSHIPKTLQHLQHPKELQNAVYSAHVDGSLKRTPSSPAVEEERQAEQTTESLSWWKRAWSCCCLKSKESEDKEDLQTPFIEKEASPKDSIYEETFLGPQRACDAGKKTLVLDLDETLVHSSFQPTQRCQYVIPVEIEGNVYNVYVFRRPGVAEFLERMSVFYEIVVYTASMKKYADPLLDKMDPNHRISYRLFRDHCVNSEGVFVKDLGLLGRDMQSVVMIDNCRTSYKFQPKNGIECTPFIDNFEDNELMEMTPFLEYLSKKPDVRLFAGMWNESRESQSQIVTYNK
ncbi:hypothetical protein WA577_003800 [Blastocystis sp. JDR]